MGLIRRARGWRIAFLVLSVVALLFWTLVVIGIAVGNPNNAGNASAGSSPASHTLPTTPPPGIGPGAHFQTVRWGTTVALTGTVGPSSATAGFTLAASDLRYPTSATMGPGARGNASAKLRVCATKGTVDLGLVAVLFTLNGTGQHRYGSISDTPVSFLGDLHTGHCQSATLVFRVPSGGKVTGASFTPDGGDGQGVIWNGG